MLGAAAALILVTGLGVWRWRPENNDNFPDGTFWMCLNPQCKAEFVLTMKQLGEHHEKHYGQPIPCPKCQGTQTIRAGRCTSCKKFYPLTPGLQVCPHCKKPVKPRET
ncbi:MAG: hypothetical protein ACM359_13725 [Bacillota bacterium]